MNQITQGGLFDVVTDATGNHHSMANALQYVSYSGSLVYVGITTRGNFIPPPPPFIAAKSVYLLPAMPYPKISPALLI